MDWTSEDRGMFGGLVFTLSLGNENLKTKKEIVDIIKKNGGSIDFAVTRNTTHYVAKEQEISEMPFKLKTAYKYGAQVVLPSFIFDSVRCAKKANEWEHTSIDGKTPATKLAKSEEDLVMRAFSRSLNNVTGIYSALDYPKEPIREAVLNISSICMQILSKTADFSISQNHYSRQPLHSLVKYAFTALDQKARGINVAQEQDEEEEELNSKSKKGFGLLSDKKSSVTMNKKPPKQRVSTLRTEKRTVDVKSHFKSSVDKVKGPSFLDKVAEKRKEREEKIQKQMEEKMKRDEEKRIRDEEARRASEELKARIEAEKRRLEEERERSRRELEERLNQTTDFMNFGGMEEQKEKISPEVLAQQERERKKQEEKAKKKQRREEKKEIKQKEMAETRMERIKRKKQQKEEEERKQKEKEEAEVKRKQLARIEYEARHERKRIKAIKGETVTKPPTLDDRKLFVGGFQWKDLERKKLKPDLEAKVKAERVKNLLKMFDQFGPVVKRRDQVLSKGFCFVTFASIDSYEKALETLSKFEERERISKEEKEKMKKDGGKEAALCAHSPHYYVRRVNAVTEPVKKGKKSKLDNK